MITPEQQAILEDDGYRLEMRGYLVAEDQAETVIYPDGTFTQFKEGRFRLTLDEQWQLAWEHYEVHGSIPF